MKGGRGEGERDIKPAAETSITGTCVRSRDLVKLLTTSLSTLIIIVFFLKKKRFFIIILKSLPKYLVLKYFSANCGH